ncbi:hypothetical protein [Pseudomonas peradeniyensis]|uniref:Uncharacterized protein n=1 Tax=Pseudomonas peradeniyensis TaxID=2745488 RepID=A0ABT2V9V7_9PSED|nr:hypothetical protein [Pseudomonas peradeniyensis]MCU7238521.1 hypothetical protein [Pseudomonas peradeniyensis]
MITFSINRYNPNEPAEDLDQGEIVLCNGKTKLSTGSTMLYLSITLLIDGVVSLGKTKRKYEFIPIDRSFSISLLKHKKNIKIMYKKEIFTQASLIEIAQALDEGLHEFLSKASNNPAQPGAIALDLADSKIALKALIDSINKPKNKSTQNYL